jgi:hypothetical protein
MTRAPPYCGAFSHPRQRCGHEKCPTVPRQQKYNTARKQWQDVKQQAYQTNQGQILFITNKVEQGDVIIKHLPTEQMWIDLNTKPQTGHAFQVDQAKNMSCDMDIPGKTLSPVLPGILAGRPVVHKWCERPGEQRVMPSLKDQPAPRLQECVGNTPYIGGDANKPTRYSR